MPRLRHLDKLDTARFVTFSCYQREKLLKSERELMIVAKHLCKMSIEKKIKIHGYVLMPSHIHLILTSPPEINLGIEIGRMKALSAREILSNWRNENSEIPARGAIKISNVGQPVLWHRRCYDHNCRSIDTVREKINYCHKNPVKSGLVSAPEEWKYSSYNWYIGERNVPVKINEIEL